MDRGADCYRRFLDGDESAFGEIIDIYRENLMFFLNRYVRDLTTAEDLSEDVFVELLVHPRRYNFKTSFKTYLFAIGRHKALDWLRKASVRRETPTDSAELASVPSGDTEDFEERFLLDERKRKLHEAMSKLNDDYRTALHLVYFEELSAEQAGQVMKKSRKQIENLLYRAKNALRTLMKDEVLDFEEQG
ncbi:MAG: RNA polymerase sigma factor [Oscillospiraceae bacterium]|nr:RNA polymerase sigma factor [Oscillospiraceae bacterium]